MVYVCMCCVCLKIVYEEFIEGKAKLKGRVLQLVVNSYSASEYRNLGLSPVKLLPSVLQVHPLLVNSFMLFIHTVKYSCHGWLWLQKET